MQAILLSEQLVSSEYMFNTAAEKGFIAILLIVFVWYFLSRSRNDDKKVKEAYETSQNTIAEQNKTMREREDYLLAESARREEIIRTEAEKREKLIKAEAEKRESILMASQDRMLDTLDNIAESLSKVEKSISSQDQRLDAIERKMSNGSTKGDGS